MEPIREAEARDPEHDRPEPDEPHSESSPTPGEATSSAPNTIDTKPPIAIQSSLSSSFRKAMAAMTWNVPIAIAQMATR